ncbi:hypothetical protein D3C71_1187250 [compost metagenome]
MADGGDMQVAGVFVEGLALLAVGIHRIPRRQPVIDGVPGTFALAGGAAGKAVDQRVLIDIGFDVRLVLRHALKQCPEEQRKAAIGRWLIHADYHGTAGAQHVAVLLQQPCLDENDLGGDKFDLPTVLFERVSKIGMRNRRFALERCPGMQQRQVVVF